MQLLKFRCRTSSRTRGATKIRSSHYRTILEVVPDICTKSRPRYFNSDSFHDVVVEPKSRRQQSSLNLFSSSSVTNDPGYTNTNRFEYTQSAGIASTLFISEVSTFPGVGEREVRDQDETDRLGLTHDVSPGEQLSDEMEELPLSDTTVGSFLSTRTGTNLVSPIDTQSGTAATPAISHRSAGCRRPAATMNRPQEPLLEEDKYEYLYNVVVVGDATVGTTHWLSRYNKGTLLNAVGGDEDPTGVEFATRTVSLSCGSTVKAQWWDMAGHDRVPERSALFRRAGGALLMYDITDGATLQSCTRYLEELRSSADPGVVIMLVGNKLDLVERDPERRQVSFDSAKKWALHHDVLFAAELSDSFVDVEHLFDSLLQNIYNRGSRFYCGEESSFGYYNQQPRPERLKAWTRAPPYPGSNLSSRAGYESQAVMQASSAEGPGSARNSCSRREANLEVKLNLGSEAPDSVCFINLLFPATLSFFKERLGPFLKDMEHYFSLPFPLEDAVIIETKSEKVLDDSQDLEQLVDVWGKLSLSIIGRVGETEIVASS